MTTAQCIDQHRELRVQFIIRRFAAVDIKAVYVPELQSFYLYAGPRLKSIANGGRADRLAWTIEDASRLLDQISIFGRAQTYELVLRNPALNYMRYTSLVVRAGEIPLERAGAIAMANDCEIHELIPVEECHGRQAE